MVVVCLSKILTFPIKFFKHRVVIFLYDFINIVAVCLVYQVLVTILNYGIFRAYFTISYILGVVLCCKLIISPLEKLLLKLYNNIKTRGKLKICKKGKRQL